MTALVFGEENIENPSPESANAARIKYKLASCGKNANIPSAAAQIPIPKAERRNGERRSESRPKIGEKTAIITAEVIKTIPALWDDIPLIT